MKRTNFYKKLEELHHEELKEIKFLFEKLQKDDKVEINDGYEAFIITSVDGWDTTCEERVTSITREDGCLHINCYNYDGIEAIYSLEGSNFFDGGLTDLVSTLQDMYSYKQQRLLEAAKAAQNANKNKYPDYLQLYKYEGNYVCFEADAKAAAKANLSCVNSMDYMDDESTYFKIFADQLDFYIQKLISSGYKIAIFDCNEVLKESK